jgi:peptide/nickel transport system substrate-binding protein
MYKAIVGLATISLAAAACSSSKSAPKASSTTKTDTPNTINSAKVVDGGKIVAVLEKTVKFFNILDANGSNFDTVQIVNGISPTAFIVNPDYSATLNTDLLADASVQAGAANQTVVYHIKPNAVWDDGTPIDAKDFQYAWISQNGADAKITAASTAGYADVASVTGSDNGKTVTVVWKQGKTFPDWKSLFGALYPEHLAEKNGFSLDTVTGTDGTVSAKDAAGLEKSWEVWGTTPTWSGGPYKITDHAADGTSTVVQKNPKWYGTEVHLDQITFKTITDATQEPTAIGNGEVDMIQPQPQQNLLTQLAQFKATVGVQVSAGLVFEHYDFNLQNTALGGPNPADQKDPAKLALRKALFTAVDRKHLIASTVGLFDPAAKPLDSRMFVPGQDGYQDNVTKYGLGSGNIEAAKKLLTDAGYTGVGTKLVDKSGKEVPSLRMRYTVGNKIREDECKQFAAAAQQLGVTITVESTDDLNATLNNADPGHAFDVVVFAWVATPFPDSSNGPLYQTNPAGTKSPAGGNYGWYSNADADKALADAGVNLDAAKANADLNKADDLVSQDAYTLPLYQKDTMVAYKKTLANIRDNSTSVGPTYNIQQWGTRATTS